MLRNFFDVQSDCTEGKGVLQQDQYEQHENRRESLLIQLPADINSAGLAHAVPWCCCCGVGVV